LSAPADSVTSRQTESMNRSNSTTQPADWRERLIEAVIAETVQSGYAELRIERIARRAGATPAQFHAHFAGKAAAVEAAYESLFERYLSRLLATCEAQSSWPLKVKVGIGVTLDMASASPVEAQFLAVEAIAIDGDLRQRVLDLRDRLARLLVAGRTETPHGAELPGVVESALVGGIAGVITTQLQDGEARQLPALAPELVELTLTPYLGREEAAEVAGRPYPPVKGPQ
jgi:AcrR family transcriptional regulator